MASTTRGRRPRREEDVDGAGTALTARGWRLRRGDGVDAAGMVSTAREWPRRRGEGVNGAGMASTARGRRWRRGNGVNGAGTASTARGLPRRCGDGLDVAGTALAAREWCRCRGDGVDGAGMASTTRGSRRGARTPTAGGRRGHGGAGSRVPVRPFVAPPGALFARRLLHTSPYTGVALLTFHMRACASFSCARPGIAPPCVCGAVTGIFLILLILLIHQPYTHFSVFSPSFPDYVADCLHTFGFTSS